MQTATVIKKEENPWCETRWQLHIRTLPRSPKAAPPRQRLHPVKDCQCPSKLPPLTALPAGCREDQGARSPVAPCSPKPPHRGSPEGDGPDPLQQLRVVEAAGCSVPGMWQHGFDAPVFSNWNFRNAASRAPRAGFTPGAHLAGNITLPGIDTPLSPYFLPPPQHQKPSLPQSFASLLDIRIHSAPPGNRSKHSGGHKAPKREPHQRAGTDAARAAASRSFSAIRGSAGGEPAGRRPSSRPLRHATSAEGFRSYRAAPRCFRAVLDPPRSPTQRKLFLRYTPVCQKNPNFPLI